MFKKEYEKLNKEELGGELKFMLNIYFKSLIKSIKSKNDLIEFEDCYNYIYERLKDDSKFKSGKHFYIWIKHRLIDYYRKIKRDLEIQTTFKDIYCFVSENYDIKYNEIVCILLSINPKFNKFLNNTSFYSRNRIDYRKMNKPYMTFIKRNNLDLIPKNKLIKEYIIEAFNSKGEDFIYKEVEYNDYEDYSRFIDNTYGRCGDIIEND